MTRRTLLATAGPAITGLPALARSSPARAAAHPTCTVRMLVGFPWGGASGIQARGGAGWRSTVGTGG